MGIALAFHYLDKIMIIIFRNFVVETLTTCFRANNMPTRRFTPFLLMFTGMIC